MPAWSEILSEIGGSVQNGQPDLDGVRRKYLAKLYQKTNRNVILYASGWLQKDNAPSSSILINDEDMQAFMEVCYQLKAPNLDLILHSPGGSPEAAEAIVSYLRSRFSDIRVIVPQLAMSAATMIACSSNSVVLGKHSFLGPTDPQLLMPTSLGARAVAAQSVLDQFDLAKQECADPNKLPAWLPMLQQYGPDLLVQCKSALRMTRKLVKTWLNSYMFDGEPNALEKAKKISKWLAEHKNFNSHSRHIPREEIENRGLKVERLENDQEFQDLTLSVFHSTTHTFSHSASVKIIENHAGRAFVKLLAPPQSSQPS